MPAGHRIGVDLVEVSRFATGDQHRARLLRARILSAAEDGAADDAEGMAAHWALKEATVKAIGGRWTPFSWTDMTVVDDSDGDCRTEPLIGALAAAMTGLGRDVFPTFVRVCVRPVVGAPRGDLHGAWCRLGDHVAAVVAA